MTGRHRIGLEPFVGPRELQPHLDAVVLADVRWSLDGSQGRDQYLAATLPGAVFVDLDTDLSGPPTASGGRHPLPSPAAFAAALAAVGIGDDDVVVAFDHGPGVAPARLVWMLRTLGQRAALLDGGLAAWPGPTTPGGRPRSVTRRTTVPWPDSALIDTDGVSERVAGETGSLLLDARDRDRFAGLAVEPGGAPGGHLPGARSAPASNNLADGQLADLEALRSRYGALGTFEAPEVVAYCGSGVAACLDLLVLERLGVHGRLYPGSWSAWSADLHRPVATGTG